MIMSLVQARARYGAINNGVWGDESKWCSLIEIPAGLESWINTLTGKPVAHVYCNNDMAPALLKALGLVISRGLASQLKTFDGCFMIRDVRAIPNQLSAHAYAGAIDLNASTNHLGTPGDISDELASCFTECGFIWGKRFKRCDPMHFSYLGW